MILIPAKLSTQIKNAEAEFNNPIATQNIESIKKKMPFDNLLLLGIVCSSLCLRGISPKC